MNDLYLSRIMQDLGYLVSQEGLCHGLTYMWIQAVLSKQADLFIQRLNLTYHHPDLSEKLIAIKSKLGIVTEEDLTFIDVQAFLEGIYLHQSPEIHNELFTKSISQAHTDQAFQFTISLAMEAFHIKNIYSEIGIYDPTELNAYLSELAAQFTEGINAQAIVFSMEGEDHTIGIQYHPDKQQWTILNSLTLPPYSLNQADLISEIFAAFREKTKIAFITRAYVTDPLLENLAIPFNVMKRNHSLTATKMAEKTDRGISVLFCAAQNDDIELTRIAIERQAELGTDLNIQLMDGTTPLHIAAENGHSTIIKLLMQAGADTNISNHEGSYPIHLAFQNGHADVVKLLLLHPHTLLNPTDLAGRNSVHYAAGGNTTTFEILAAEKDVNLNVANAAGQTPLQIAAQYNKVGILELLKSRGIDLTQVDNEGDSIVHFAAMKGHVEVLNFAKENRLPLELADHHHRTPIEYAAHSGHTEAFKFLLSQGVSLKVKKYLAHFAAMGGSISILHQLQEIGASLTSALKDGQKPFHLAARHNQVSALQFFIALGVDLSEPNHEGQDAAHYATLAGNIETLRFLAKNKFPLHQADSQQMTPAHHAAQTNQGEMLAFFIDQGIDLSKRDQNKMTVVDHVLNNMNASVLNEIAKHGLDLNYSRLNISRLLDFGKKLIPILLNPRTEFACSPDESEQEKLADKVIKYVKHLKDESQQREILYSLINQQNVLGRMLNETTRAASVSLLFNDKPPSDVSNAMQRIKYEFAGILKKQNQSRLGR